MHACRSTLEDPTDAQKPFARDLLFPRAATVELKRKLAAGELAVVIEGAPIIGKSNVLRDFAAATRDSPEWAVLMVNGATAGGGLFQRIANLFGTALEWTLSADQVRSWVRRMSQSERRPALVLAVDGVRAGSAVAADLEELAETGFGAGLRLVATTDRASDLLLDTSGRGETAFAPIASEIAVGRLDDDEFAGLRARLEEQRIHFFSGAELSDEYRAPWVLRTVLGSDFELEDPDHRAFLPATLGLGLIASARARLAPLHEVARNHRLIARDALADTDLHPELQLQATSAFIVRRDRLTPAGEAAAVALEQDGWASFTRSRQGEDLLSFRVPEFYLSEVAHELVSVIEGMVDDDPEEAALNLTVQAGSLFLGDIAGAQAIFDLGRKRPDLPSALIETLMNDRPEAESIAGKLIGVLGPDGEIMNFRFDHSGGVAPANDAGEPIGPFMAFDEEVGDMQGNTTSWLILSQLAALPLGMGPGDAVRVDQEIMLWIGREPMPLLRGASFDRIRPHSVQDLGDQGSVLSAEHALAEPLTSAMHRLFGREWRTLDPFFEQLIAADSLPLTVRVHHALAGHVRSTDDALAEWAQAMLTEIIHPLLRRQMAPVPA